MKNKEDLRRLLQSIDHRGYPAYKDTRGVWRFENYDLSIDHVQGDPFASPSSLSLVVPGRVAGIPGEYYGETHRRVALEDHLLRLFERELSHMFGQAGFSAERPDESSQDARRGRGGEGRPEAGGPDMRRGGRRGSGKSGYLGTSRPGQEVLKRSACSVNPRDGSVRVCLEAGFPAAGRTILAEELITMLFEILPLVVRRSLLYGQIRKESLRDAIFLSDDQAYVRNALAERNLCAFLADGSILPRRSGISQLPMRDAVPFRSPDETALELELPHRGRVRGMGIQRGVTLIVGGGYHGKSTLLEALERGVYNHIAGDGRELVITEESAMKIRAEDGRCVKHKDISLFINHLPSGRDTSDFSTEDASGSTSQAAAVVEAMEAGAGTLLIDEDTSATNFMVRDELMAEIVLKEQEPITPFISRIRDLYEKSGISTVLVAGSSGAYFHVADHIIQMDCYMPCDITKKVREILRGAGNQPEGVFRAGGYRDVRVHVPVRPDAALRREQRLKLKVLRTDSFMIAHREVDLRGLMQVVDREQTRTLSYILKYMELHILDGRKTLQEAVCEMEKLLKREGIDVLFEHSHVSNGLAEVRVQEIFGTLNRYRG